MNKISKKIVGSIILIVVLILIAGASYAWLQSTVIGEKSNDLIAGTLSLNLDETTNDGINVAAAIPMTSDDGKKTVPYTFVLENNGTIASDYTIYLDDINLDDGQTRLEDNIINYYLTKDETEEENKLNGLGTSPSRIIDRGNIAAGEKQTYTIRLWIDESAGREIAGKVFKAQLRIEGLQDGRDTPTTDQTKEVNLDIKLIKLTK